MVLWTIQSLVAWKTLRGTRVLRANEEVADKDFLRAYRWMSDRMEERIGGRFFRGALPLWAWYQWEGEKRRKPDLRARGHLPPGERGVRIEFEIDDRGVVLSDFELWHYVLNYWYLPCNKDDASAFEAELERRGISSVDRKALRSSSLGRRIERSWLRMFDLEWACEYVSSAKREKSIQSTFWELKVGMVREVTEFRAR